MLNALYIACIFSFASLIVLFLTTAKKTRQLRASSVHWFLIAFATFFQATLLTLLIVQETQILLGFSNATMLVSFCIWCMTLLLMRLSNTAYSLLLLSFLNIFVYLFAWLSPDLNAVVIRGETAFHVVLSILSYSIVGLTGLQSIILLATENMLHEKRGLKLLSLLPSLNELENALYFLLWMSFISLSIALFSGFLVLDDMFEQRVVHKTFLSLLCWGMIAVLLVLKLTCGWRGKQLSIGIMLSTLILFLGFSGSKFIIERLLS